jgi:hypothetical protein
MKFHMNTPNILYYVFLELNIQYEYYTSLILHKTSSVRIKNCHLNKFILFYVILAS